MSIPQKVIGILLKAGLNRLVAETLADRIDTLYQEAQKERHSQWARKGGLKGGKAKSLKGMAKLKVSDPEAYTKARENYRKAALRREEIKRNA